MYNLIQIQDAIKTVPLKDVMDYANGKNPQIPAYLALSELNRRKQIQETVDAFYGEPGNLKEQIQSSLTQAPAGMDITQTPPGQIDVTKVPPQLAPSLPPVGQVQPGAAPQGQVNPTAAPPMLAARGGLMRSPDIARGVASIPISQFKRRNYAGGGIVAFADTPPPGRTVGQAADEDFFERFFGDKRRPLYRDPVTGEGPPPVTPEEAAETERMRNAPRFRDAARSIADFFYLTGEGPLQQRVAERERTTRDLPKDIYSNEGRAYEKGKALEAPKDKPLIVSPRNQNEQASATGSGQISRPPAAAPTAPAAPARPSVADRLGTGVPTQDETRAAIDRQKMLMREFGISQDPYADVRRRYEKIEEERSEKRKEEPFDRLMEMLGAYSEAAPEKGLGYQLGQAGKASAIMRKEQRAVAEKQDMEMAKLYESMAKEEDARKRGDMKAVETELANQKAHKIKIIELENQSTQAQAQMINALAQRTVSERGPQSPAEIQLVERIAKEKGISFTEAYEFLQSAKNIEKIRADAISDWNKNPIGNEVLWKDKGGFAGYMASRGLAIPAGGAPAAGPKAPAPKKGDVVQGYRFKGGDPSKQENWEKV